MTQGEKQQLIIELCSRLPYGVMVRTAVSIKTLTCEILSMIIDGKNTFTILPYYRPMSSMTEEEQETYECFFDEDGLLNTSVDTYLDWLLENHFDYRGSIGKGIALDAKDMYNNKTE